MTEYFDIKQYKLNQNLSKSLFQKEQLLKSFILSSHSFTKKELTLLTDSQL